MKKIWYYDTEKSLEQNKKDVQEKIKEKQQAKKMRKRRR
jgi:hypothetical protein